MVSFASRRLAVLRCAISGRLQLREPKWIRMMSSMMTTTMMTTPTTTTMMMMLVVVMMSMLTAVVVTMIMLMHICIHVRTHARTYPYNFGSMFLPPDHGVVLPPRYRWARAARRAMGGIRTFRIVLEAVKPAGWLRFSLKVETFRQYHMLESSAPAPY